MTFVQDREPHQKRHHTVIAAKNANQSTMITMISEKTNFKRIRWTRVWSTTAIQNEWGHK